MPGLVLEAREYKPLPPRGFQSKGRQMAQENYSVHQMVITAMEKNTAKKRVQEYQRFFVVTVCAFNYRVTKEDQWREHLHTNVKEAGSKPFPAEDHGVLKHKAGVSQESWRKSKEAGRARAAQAGKTEDEGWQDSVCEAWEARRILATVRADRPLGG